MKTLLMVLAVAAGLIFSIGACSGGGSGSSLGTMEAAPSAPTGVTVSPGNGRVTVTWSAVTGATAYNIYYRTTSGVSTSDNKLVNVSTPYGHSGLTNGTTYYYVVTAQNASGESAVSVEASGTPQVPVPNVPTGVTALPGNGKVTVFWGPATGATSFNIYFKTTPGVSTTDTKLANASTPYDHTGLTNMTAYYYVVTAQNASGESAVSAEVSAMPGSPQNLSAAAGVQKATLTWSADDGATGYNLYWSVSPGVTKATGTKIPNVTSPYVRTHLTAGDYYYVVTATYPGSESIESNQVWAPVNLVSFITSSTGNGNLGSWPDAVAAGSATGLAAGDAICQARANGANLTGTFKAWLSSGGTITTDAYCHIQNMTGTKANNCGQAALPVSAGPWIRTDGTPFAGTIDQLMTSPYVLTAASYNEFGNLVPNNYHYTSTTLSGERDTGFAGCNNWTDGSGASSTLAGIHYYTAWYWTSGFAPTCNIASSLLCMQTGPGPALPNLGTTGKKVFVTSTSYNGNLGGLAGADSLCQARAAAGGFANAANFKAWLSDTTTDAKDRLTSNGPWVRPDGFGIADTKADLIDGHILTSINQNELGAYTYYDLYVWTGTDANGIKTADRCTDWTDGTAGSNGLQGLTVGTDSSWSSYPGAACTSLNHVYCFED